MLISFLKKNTICATLLFCIIISLLISGCQNSNNTINNPGVHLQSISITTTNPILHLETKQQFIATGIYSNGTTQNITTSVLWNSSNINIATISNASTSQGIASTVASGNCIITATLNGISATNNITISAASLQSISITPTNPVTHLSINKRFLLTGVYSDGVQDLTVSATWSSSNPNIATISNIANTAGISSPVNAGTSTITATFNGMSTTSKLTVLSGILQSIQVSPLNSIAHLNINQQFTATGIYSDYTTENLTSYVTWASSSSNIATISNISGSQGLATPVATGSSNITASFSNIIGTTTLTVSAATINSFSLNLSFNNISKNIQSSIATIPLGVNQQCVATVTFTDGSTQNVTTSTIWSSSTSSIATISNASGSQGLIAPIAIGSTIITATLGTYSSSINIIVSGATLQSILITPAIKTTPLGFIQQYKAIGTYSDGSTQNVTSTAIWNSSTPSIATISNASNSQGLATPVAIGNTNITASLNGVTSNTSLLSITNIALTTIIVTPATSTIPLGTTQQFIATGIFSDNSIQNLTNSVIWNSSNSNTATVSNTPPVQGLANAVAAGNTTISASFAAISGNASLIVTTPTLQSITINPANPNLSIGATQQFTALGTYSDGSQVNLTNSVTWSSTSPNIATISNSSGNNGLATAIVIGSTNIIATYNSISATTILSVVNNSFLYFTNSNSVIFCQINTNGDLSNCNNTATITAANDIAINGSSAYVVSTSGNSVYLCSRNTTNGQLSACAITASGFSNPLGITINSGFAYVANNGNSTVFSCTVNANNSLSGCASTGTTFVNPYSVITNNGFAYAANYGGGSVSLCTISAGTLTSCATTGSGFTNPSHMLINNGYAYVPNFIAASVSQCAVNPITGVLTGCTNSGATGLSSPTGIGIYNGFAYISNQVGGSPAISKCSVNASTGALSGCVNSGATLATAPNNITISGS